MKKKECYKEDQKAEISVAVFSAVSSGTFAHLYF